MCQLVHKIIATFLLIIIMRQHSRASCNPWVIMCTCQKNVLDVQLLVVPQILLRYPIQPQYIFCCLGDRLQRTCQQHAIGLQHGE